MLLAAAAIAIAAQATSASADLAVAPALETALSTCEQWILNPETWADGFDEFPEKSGMAARGLRVEPTVPDFALPPPEYRRAMHHWRVPVGEGGIYVTASDQIPICHLAGGGAFDFQPGVAGTQSSAEFLKHWKAIAAGAQGDMVSTRYLSLRDAKLSLILSRAGRAKGRTDRVQIIATVQYDIGR